MAAMIELDAYVVETLMRDLVGHDRRPSAYLVYLAIAAADVRQDLSHAALAQRTGLSKRAVQDAVGLLERRKLVEAIRRGPTEPARYKALTPWRR